MKRFVWVLGLISMWLSAQANAGTILVMGDSISAAYGMAVPEGWVSLLQEKLKQTPGLEQERVVNASISGETSGGGLVRLPQALTTHQPDWVLLELGANDGLRGMSPTVMKSNLESMVRLSRQAGAQVLLLGMKIPPSYGPRYIQMFYEVYSQLADALHLPQVPFILEEVALDPTLMQADGLHPNARAQALMADRIAKTLIPLLQSSRSTGTDPHPP